MAVQSEQSSEMLTLPMAPASVGMMVVSEEVRHGDFGNRQRPCEAVKESRRDVELSLGLWANAAVQLVSLLPLVASSLGLPLGRCCRI